VLAEISANAEKSARPQRLTAGNSCDLRMALALQFVRAWNVRQVEHDLKDRKVRLGSGVSNGLLKHDSGLTAAFPHVRAKNKEQQ
jgi:hypothetical protein